MILFNLNNAFRRIFKRKLNTAVNILGLSISLAACIFILIWVLNETNFDKFHSNIGNIYRVNLRDKTYDEPHNYRSTPPPLSASMLQDFPEIESIVTFETARNLPVKFDEVKLNADICFTNDGFFNIFTFPFKEGNGDKLFSTPYSIIISSAVSQKIFGEEDPIGKTITIGDGKEFTVSGIIHDIPHQSSLKIEFLTSFDYLEEIAGYGNVDDWDEWSCETFILLPENVDAADFENKILDYAALKADYEWAPELYLQPLENIHLYHLNGGGPIVYVTIFSIVAVFILLIACINFINLSTAQSTLRIKEIGIRKIIGASRKNLISQILTESFMLVTISMLLSFGIVELLYPLFTDFTGQMLSQGDLFSSYFVFLLLGIYLLTGFISGLYPALYLSVIKPSNSLKPHPKAKSSLLRKILIIVQFSISIFLIISSIVVYKQFRFLRNKELGFNAERVLYIPLNHEIEEKYSSFKYELQQNPRILQTTMTSGKIGMGGLASFDLKNWKGNAGEHQLLVSMLSVHYDFLEMFGLEMVDGEFYTEEKFSEDMGHIFNETAIRSMGIQEPVGSKLFGESHIQGVIKDFNFKSLHSEIEPLMISFESEWFSYIVIKIAGEELSGSLKHIESTFNKFSPDAQFEYQFSDAAFDRLYHSEEQMMVLFGIFSFVAIVLSSLGLFALSLFLLQSRLKEIGIRKVLGSSAQGILFLLSKDFIKWVLISFVIAAPTAYFVLNKWLINYAYRISINIWVFVVTGCIALSIALITVSLQTIKGAYANPADILKQE